VQVAKVDVSEPASTSAAGTSTDDEALLATRQVVKQPVVVSLAIHDVHDVLVCEPLSGELGREPPAIMLVVPTSSAVARAAIPSV